MTLAAPRQISLPLRIPQECPLLPVKTVICLLLRCGVASAEDVAELIDNGDLEYAFDLRRPGAAHAMPVAWRGSVEDFMARQESPERQVSAVSGLEEVIDDILPGPCVSLRAVALKTRFGVCDRKHVIRLIADGALSADPARPVGRGPAQSPWVTRASAAEFLRKRRMA